jgi:hypothetical protein
MAIFKCKMCGGNLEVNEKSTVGICQYCGSTMTLPKDSDEKKANLFNRANHYRRNNDFNKAMATYENILNEDNNDAEAHWGVVLCKYGIEYVEDPKTNKRIPTCHRAQYGSILADEDYKQALANADEQARLIYEQEAKAIEGIQKQILEISSKEEPFDVFICYKETSETGSRTKDSVIAQDIYYQLTEAGFKVFFSRITLEDKLGTAYEPYIFAALNSSKVMVVVGTKPEHFNATWTKNEWSRYLGLIKGGAKKVLIPAYRDMDAYELPEEFSHLQAQDMSRLGFMQDLERGIRKVVNFEESKASLKNNEPFNIQTNVSPLVVRAFLCIEDGDFQKADELLEQVLNLSPMEPKAYVGKLLIEFGLHSENELASYEAPLDNSKNYQKAIRFSDQVYSSLLENYNIQIKQRIEQERIDILVKINETREIRQEPQTEAIKEEIYNHALIEKRLMQNINTVQYAGRLFRSIPGYKNADVLAIECDALEKQVLLRERMEEEEELQKWRESRGHFSNSVEENSITYLIVGGVGLFLLFIIISALTN